MTIKQQGGIFGRNPTFNDLEVEGSLTVGGSPISGTSGEFEDLEVKVLAGDTNIYGSCYSDNGGNEVTVELRKSNQDTEGNTATSDGDRLGSFTWRGNSGSGFTVGSRIRSAQLGAASTQTPAEIKFETSNGSSFSEKMNISPTGDVKINTGNLIIGTSGNGIDFSATSGTGTSELFDDYEEGVHDTTITPQTSGTITLNASYSQLGYTKIGNLVSVRGYLIVSSVASPVGNFINISLPFTSVNDFSKRAGGAVSTFSIGVAGYSTLPAQIVENTSSLSVLVDASTLAASDQITLSFCYQAA